MNTTTHSIDISDIVGLGAEHYLNPSASDIHRKIHQPIRLPAVTRHLSYRRDESDINETTWIDRIEGFILNIRGELVNRSRENARKAHPHRNVETITTNLRNRHVEHSSDSRRSREDEGDSIELLRNSYAFSEGAFRYHHSISHDGSRYEIVVIRSEWEEMPVVLRFEVFEEYFTISIAVEFVREHGVPTSTNHSEAMSWILRTLNDHGPRSTDSKFAASIKQLREEIWSDFDTILEQSVDSIGKSAQQRWINEQFADFRGFLLETTPTSGNDTCIANISGIDSISTIPGNLSLTKRLCSRGNFTTESGKLKFTETLFPLLLTADHEGYEPGRTVNKTRSTESSEYTWSTFEKDIALYGSNLGKTTIRGGLSDRLTYVLLFDTDDDRTVGRIVGRLHTLGTIRVASVIDFGRTLVRDQILSNLDFELAQIDATRDMESLKANIDTAVGQLSETLVEIKRILRSVEKKLYFGIDVQKSLAIIESYQTRTTDYRVPHGSYLHPHIPEFQDFLTSNERDLESLTSLLRNISAFCRRTLGPNSRPMPISTVERHFWRNLKRECKRATLSIDNVCKSNSIEEYRQRNLDSVIHALTDMNDHMRFGLRYRNNRSRYYQDLFINLAKAMDIGSIPGFQKYDDYVSHKLYRAHSFTAFTEDKHSNILQLANALKEKIELTRKELHDAKMHRFQAFGEVALVWVISPYYLMSVYDKIFVHHAGWDVVSHILEWGGCVMLVIFGRWLYECRAAILGSIRRLTAAR
ncbi:hypothetical protein [Pelomonas sp. KK5]|uniref:hypothetical protein n=1 Tax=Pelomonas sp. KK5 TaxID=1855730 RepID=UPI001181309C|nr:hypothetical protein [Pelomonas sp. KK5]